MRLAAALAVPLLACASPAEAPRASVPPAESSGSASAPPTDAAAPPTGASGSCQDIRFGGWDGDAECVEAAAQVIAGADRVCAVDADCVSFGPNCGPHAVVAARVAHYQAWPAPCTHPAGGQCPPACGAACVDGCCDVVHFGACP